MTEPALRRLPRGRHPLSREQVEADQRLRILLALAETMSRQGYAHTPVADIIRAAGVSRETFYRLFDDKLDAFMAAFDLVGELLLAAIAASIDAAADAEPLQRVERAVATYLETIALEPPYARLFLIEVYAAGPPAIRRRHEVQTRIVENLAVMFGSRSEAAHFACQVIVSSVSALLVEPLIAEDADAVLALREPVLDHIRSLAAAGIFST